LIDHSTSEAKKLKITQPFIFGAKNFFTGFQNQKEFLFTYSNSLRFYLLPESLNF